ncbi:hypothetical protein [Lysobacter sp. Root494]|uniref:hypothetical protein n=1 Tax=Lysobacter sp. Root494 TaxID=1736549 RepID=UPI0006F7932D|nr:hypothetical protein [Lysobacter sp. Root494]KQY54905.1 hypothetical protein ASD14_01690 [Lysobacter sp. Root494]
MTARKLAGFSCVAAGFALILSLGYGVIDPVGASLAQASSMGAVLIALAPSVLMALGLFAIGLWLLKSARMNGKGKK